MVARAAFPAPADDPAALETAVETAGVGKPESRRNIIAFLACR